MLAHNEPGAWRHSLEATFISPPSDLRRHNRWTGRSKDREMYVRRVHTGIFNFYEYLTLLTAQGMQPTAAEGQ